MALMVSIVSTFAGDGLVKIWARSQLAMIAEGFEIVLGRLSQNGCSQQSLLLRHR